MKRFALLVCVAALSSPLWSQSNSDPLDKLAGTTGAFSDPIRGVSATVPAGWTIRAAERWGKEETTIFMKAPNTMATQPSLYYRVLPVKPAPGLEGAKKYLREEVEKKAASRRSAYPDYAVRPNSLVFRTVNGRPALSYVADFSRSDGKKCSEYNTRVVGDTTVALFFMMGLDWEVEAVRPELDTMIETIKLP